MIPFILQFLLTDTHGFVTEMNVELIVRYFSDMGEDMKFINLAIEDKVVAGWVSNPASAAGLEFRERALDAAYKAFGAGKSPVIEISTKVTGSLTPVACSD